MNRSSGKVKTGHGSLGLPYLHLVLNPAATGHGQMQQLPVYTQPPSVAPSATMSRVSVQTKALSVR
eukprot:4451113-Alexandrium_andersonii.AAC.1